MSNSTTSSSPEQSLRLSLFDAFIYALMVGAGETYLPAYVLSIGLSEVLAGVISSLPMVSGAFLQLLSPRFLQLIGNHKRFVVISVFIQALSFIPLVYFTVFAKPDFWILFLILTLYWASGLAASPAWIYWMTKLVPKDSAQKYFAKRARVVQVGTLLGLVAGGVALHNKVILQHFGSVFTILFLFAFLCRSLSSWILSKKLYHANWSDSDAVRGIRESFQIFWQEKRLRYFFLLIVPYQASVFVTGPFVSPYMLGELKWNYGKFMVAIAMLFFGKMAGLYYIENSKRQWKAQSLFLLGAGLVAPGPMLWAVSDSFYYICVLQLWSGAAWSLLEVGLQLTFLADLEQSKKVATLTIYNLLNSFAILAGTFMGGQYLLLLGEHKETYSSLFIIGAVLRILFFLPMYLKLAP